MRFIDERQAATVDDIANIERQIRSELPREYTRFLLGRDGGLLDDSNCVLAIASDRILLIDEIYGVRHGAEYENVSEVRAAITETLSDGIIPVAGDRFGNEICINIRSGEIVFLDHDSFDAGVDVLPAIRPDFSSFLLTLQAELKTST